MLLFHIEHKETRMSYTKEFKEKFDDTEVKKGIIKRVSQGNTEQKLVIASSDEKLKEIKGLVYEENI